MAFRAPTICSRCRKPRPAGQRCTCTPEPRRPDTGQPDRAKPYSTPEWKALRAQHLKRQPTCQSCGASARMVDHIRPWKGDAALFLDPNNLQSLCHRCHSRKTASHDGGFGNPTEQKPGCDASGRPLDPQHPWNRS
ncbi:HNH endonuclease [Oceanibaculum indicum]|uniref:Putative HNH nuclease YajD n=1 Tax=Oceanibaculum indicum P24 TaxID=1207063 RepID=K2KDY6_9PROT|nr:HNH endonuclease [Oceanibaculum indicum P24]